MTQDEDLDARRMRLTSEINEARARVLARQQLDWAEVGDVIDSLSQDVNGVLHLYPDDATGAHAHLDRVEMRLGELKTRISKG